MYFMASCLQRCFLLRDILAEVYLDSICQPSSDQLRYLPNTWHLRHVVHAQFIITGDSGQCYKVNYRWTLPPEYFISQNLI